MPDLTLMTLGTKKGTILVYQSKNLIENDYQLSTKIVEKKEIRHVVGTKHGNEIDVYFSNEESFFWF